MNPFKLPKRIRRETLSEAEKRSRRLWRRFVEAERETDKRLRRLQRQQDADRRALTSTELTESKPAGVYTIKF